LAGFGDHQVGILLGQLLVLGIAGQSGLHRGEFRGADIAGVVLAVVPVLEFVVRAGGTGPLFEGVSREFPALHSGDGGDLLEDLRSVVQRSEQTITLKTVLTQVT